MKTKTLLLLCLLLGMVSTQLSAQGWPKGTHNEPFFWTYSGEWPIECDGQLVDMLAGELSFHLSQFVLPGEDGSDGTIVWAIQKFSGTLTSTISGEVFKVQEVDKYNRPLKTSETFTWHGIYKGNQGHTYNLWGGFDTSTGEIYFTKSICH
jgi:hypothetical protein